LALFDYSDKLFVIKSFDYRSKTLKLVLIS
jgi:hypothetical protein